MLGSVCRSVFIAWFAFFTAISAFGVAPAYSGGSGSESDPFLISSKQDLLDLAATTSHYSMCFKMTADIDLAGEVFDSAVIAGPAGGIAFTGVFDGNGFAVSNMEISAVWDEYLGFFGCVSGSDSVIKRLKIAECNISSGEDSYCIGGLCGWLESGLIEQCRVTGIIGCGPYSECLGGICGVNNGGQIQSCFTDVQIYGHYEINEIGGLCGCNDGELLNCYAGGLIFSGDDSGIIGGLCGSNSCGIYCCYSTVAIIVGDDAYEIGGLCGEYYLPTLPSIGLQTVGETDEFGVFASFWDVDSSGLTNSYGGVGKTTAQMQTQATFAGAGWDFALDWRMNGYPELKCFDSGFHLVDLEISGSSLAIEGTLDNYYVCTAVYSDGSRVGVIPELFEPDSSESLNWSTDDIRYAVIDGSGQLTTKYLNFDSVVTVTAVYSNGTVAVTDSLSITIKELFNCGAYSGGFGTEDEPFLISSKEDLLVLGQSPDDYDKHFRMIADIDLSGDRFSSSLIASSVIGQDFTGSFDGDGHVISNLAISVIGVETVYTNVPPVLSVGVNSMDSSFFENIGLFGYLYDGAEVRDLKVLNADIYVCAEWCNNVGMLCGYNDYSLIKGCKVSGSINLQNTSVAEYVGGLCGYNCGGIKGCESKAYISGGPHLYGFGGLCGCSDNDAFISECIANGTVCVGNDSQFIGGFLGASWAEAVFCNYSDASVQAGDSCAMVGGLCGFADNISSCYSLGAVSAGDNTDFIGGLCGYLSDGIYYCYSTGAVSAGSGSGNIGGLCGRMDGYREEGDVIDSFWDVETSGIEVSAYGSGLTTSEMQMQSTFADAGWDFDLTWQMNGYPELKCFDSSFYPVSVEINGAAVVPEYSECQYSCTVMYSDGNSEVISFWGEIDYSWGILPELHWSLNPGDEIYADAYAGWLETYDVDSDQSITLTVVYVDGDISLTNTLEVMIKDYETAGVYSGGAGTAENPYLIETKEDLFTMGASVQDYDKHFRMTADIDLAGELFRSSLIGAFEEEYFSGHFDGDGHVISNFTARVEDDNYTGLFSAISEEGLVENLELKSVDISGWSVGGLCGENNGVVRNCHVEGYLSVYRGAGCLCGYNEGVLKGCSVLCEVKADSWENCGEIGGISGCNNGIVAECCSAGSITSGYLSYGIGGVCGYNGGIINNSYNLCKIDVGSNAQGVGGVCGFNAGEIFASYSVGEVLIGLYGSDIGGVCGLNGGVVNNAYYYLWSTLGNNCGTALSTPELLECSSYVGFDFAGSSADGTNGIWSVVDGALPKLSWQEGGCPLPPLCREPDTALIGQGTSESPFLINSLGDFMEFVGNDELDRGFYVLNTNVDLSFTNFSASVVNRYFGGHFDGNNHVVRNVTVSSNVDDYMGVGLFSAIGGSVLCLDIDNISVVSQYGSAGSLCGHNFGIVRGCNVTALWVSGDRSAGGLCGRNGLESIIDCSASGTVTGDECVGGLCGATSGDIVRSHATGCVTGAVGMAYVGGFCGQIGNGRITECWATSAIVCGDTAYNIGGFCGYSYSGKIEGCYADTSVKCGDNSWGIGGFCGSLFGNGFITDSYATGSVISEYNSSYIGGFCGNNEYYSTISNCYAACDMNNLIFPGTGGDILPMSVEYSSDFGGFCGHADYASEIIKCFWDSTVSGMYSSDGGVGLPTTAMQLESSFTSAGWDFVGESTNGVADTWYMAGYPALSCFNEYVGIVALEIIGPASVEENSIAAYTCRAYYADESFADVTADVIWSDNSSYADILNGELTASDVSGDHAVQITASLNGITDTKAVVILNVDPEIEMLVITGPDVVSENTTAYYTCTAYYSDESSADVTTEVLWSDDSDFAAILAGSLGTSEAPADQSITITALCDGLSAFKQVTLRDQVFGGASSESFESGLGVWQSSSISDIDWIRNTGDTPTENTGPIAAPNGSYYLFTESSGNYGLTAAIEAAVDFTTTSQPLLTFDYHMYGSSMGELYVDVFDGTSWHDAVWIRTGEQHFSGGAEWSQAEIDLSAYSGMASVVIRLRGIVGPYYLSDMAIDNMSLIDMSPLSQGGFDGWTAAQGIPTGLRGYYDTPVGDGIGNLWKYVAGLTAMDSCSWSDVYTYLVDDAAGKFSMTYHKSKSAAGFELVVESRESLTDGDWTAVGMENVKIGEDGDQETWKASIPMSQKGFIRIRVIEN